MRLKEIRVAGQPPIQLFDVSNLSDVIVIAGRNGVGKTRLMQTLVSAFRTGRPSPTVRLIIEATSATEKQRWGKPVIDTTVAEDCQHLVRSLQSHRLRGSWKSSVLQFESDRTISQVNPYAFTWDDADPWTEAWGWDGTFNGLRHRWQDTLHSIFRKVRSLDAQIARRAKELRASGAGSMSLEWKDPLEPFKTAFVQLLGPKELIEADLKAQQLKYRDGTNTFTLNELSSGEREVVNIVFDFILRNPEDCVVFFDEPELHLHPELSFKLLQTLKSVGARNQFIFTTHSPDIITASLDQSVIFLAPPAEPEKNQAVPVEEQDATNTALRLLGQSVGVVALGRKLVLVEGETSSLDKQAYGSILRSQFPGLVLVPVGGKEQVTVFNRVLADVLDKTVWGVEFFMLCDRDSVPLSTDAESLEERSGGRLRTLKRYHLENYFLDAAVLAQVFEDWESESHWLRDPQQVEAKLREIARTCLPYAVALSTASTLRQRVGNVDVMVKGATGRSLDELLELQLAKASTERKRVGAELSDGQLEAVHRQVATAMTQALDASDDSWKSVIPGRPVFNMFAGAAQLQAPRLKQAYIRAALRQEPSPFADIVEIFRGFDLLSVSS